ncbi:hypothetical protein K450DRAFT_233728 [Umbelopsis ramanniana AG]|uniref:Uncharacterized protein n=1 Tax=Umbelopsis ramanniana AG TaxID=1314678 RepID=A0AAD5ED12_UMBRA|nr:uncharacterized protein K450DRAFT_233728 [Umbelopsis ramanniana AG]KAI8581229.1 hypothetical protein K450DRAFT_233728 [Umbelopsis ramanniana AG]
MTGLAWSLAIYGFAVTLSAQLVTAQTSTVAAVPANTEYANNGQATGPYEGQLNPTASVNAGGFDQSDNGANSKSQSWISSNSHWVIILVLCLLVLAALIYYISKSIRGVRKKMLKGDQDGLPLQNRGGYTAPYEQHMNESIHPPPMYSYEPPKYEQAVRY